MRQVRQVGQVVLGVRLTATNTPNDSHGEFDSWYSPPEPLPLPSYVRLGAALLSASLVMSAPRRLVR